MAENGKTVKDLISVLWSGADISSLKKWMQMNTKKLSFGEFIFGFFVHVFRIDYVT